jgi:hypothetical protein
MATAALDGRPFVVLYFADCDPSGWQMGISVARKLQAFRVLLAEETGQVLDFELHRVALVPDQVRELGLPSTPLKDSELRAGKWRAAMGTEQTEIDALAALQPGTLASIARQVLDQFYDHSLAARTAEAVEAWRARAYQVMEDALADELAAFRSTAPGKLARIRELLGELETAFDDADVFGIELPEIESPQASPPVSISDARAGTPLADSREGFVEQCRVLRDSKAYGGGDEDSVRPSRWT